MNVGGPVLLLVILFNPLIVVLVVGLGAIIALLLFLVVQIAVPFIIARNKKRLKQLFPNTP